MNEITEDNFASDMSADLIIEEDDDAIITIEPRPGNSINSNSSPCPSMARRTTLTWSGSVHTPAQDLADTDTSVNSECSCHLLTKEKEHDSRHSERRRNLAKYESHDYHPSQSITYRAWLSKEKLSRQQFYQWILMGLIGFIVGLIGFLLHQLIERISEFKWHMTQHYIEHGDLHLASLFAVGFSVALIIVSAASVIFYWPSAGGSGIPEIMVFLNGTNIPNIFSFQTMIVKFFSCVTAVGCGLPVGPEGPMVHLGALVGAGLSQLKSGTLGINLPMFQRLKTTEIRRSFISAGAAAGVASAFWAPVGGLLFSMEEVSSFWSTSLSLQTFFCCVVAVVTTGTLNSAFDAFEYSGSFGQFKTSRYILFHIHESVDINFLMFIPTIIIGALGGVFGAVFTVLNVKMAKWRQKILETIPQNCTRKLALLLEPALITVIVTLVAVYLPSVFDCKQYTCVSGKSGSTVANCLNSTKNPLHVEELVYRHKCPQGTTWQASNTTWFTNGTYSEVASLMFGTLETAVEHLFSRNTHLQYNYVPLCALLLFYFLMVCWAVGTSVACGALVPMLLIGALFGRICGNLINTAFGIHTDVPFWDWMDPGAFALIGAAAFFGGVTRLTLAVTVIMMELTDDVQILLPVMVAVLTSKWVADFFTHSMYHSLLELTNIPFLKAEPNVTVDGKVMNLELFCARDIMSCPVITIEIQMPVQVLSNLLLNTTHGGFPVISKRENGETYFFGLITRLELIAILMNEDLFSPFGEDSGENREEEPLTGVPFRKLNIHKIQDPAGTTSTLYKYLDGAKYQDMTVDLKPYINTSAVSVSEVFSLQRTYTMFRTLGLRHLTVTDSGNRVTGIITRKDLMVCLMEEKLSSLIGTTTVGKQQSTSSTATKDCKCKG